MVYDILCNIVKTHFMKLLILMLFLGITLFMLSCKKKETPTPTFTDAQIWDSVGLQYEKKYWITGNKLPDTFILHSNQTITETDRDTSIVYPISAIPIYQYYAPANQNIFSINVISSFGASHFLDVATEGLSIYSNLIISDSIQINKITNTSISFGGGDFVTY